MPYVGKLSSKGQVTVPKGVREALGLEPGDLVAYEVGDRGVTLSKVEPFDHAFHEALGGTLDEWTSREDEEAFRDL